MKDFDVETFDAVAEFFNFVFDGFFEVVWFGHGGCPPGQVVDEEDG